MRKHATKNLGTVLICSSYVSGNLVVGAGFAGKPRSRFVDDPSVPDTGVGPPPVVDIGPYEAQDASACSAADLTTQGAGIGDPGYGVPDGAITAADINYYVNLWAAGCP